MHYTLDDTIRQLEDNSLHHEFTETTNGERALWRAIIVQALMDAASNSRKAETLYHKHEAIAWLGGASKDFAIVCECAGFNPSYVRRMAKRALLGGCKWRAAPGEGRKRARQKFRREATTTPDDESTPRRAIIIAFPKCGAGQRS